MPQSIPIKSLLAIGMTEREAKLYLAMLEKSEMTAPELQRISGITRSKIYEILEQMVTEGYCMARLEGRRRYFRAVEPVRLKETLLQRLESEVEQKRHLAEDLFGRLEGIYLNRSHDLPPLDFIEVMRKREQIHRRFLSLLETTRKEIVAFNRSPYSVHTRVTMRQQEETFFRCLVRGVKVRTLYMVEHGEEERLFAHVEKTMPRGEEVRLARELPIKMMIFDREQVFFAIKTQNLPSSYTDFSMILIEDSNFASACVILFESCWNEALTLEEWRNREGVPPREEEKEG